MKDPLSAVLGLLEVGTSVTQRVEAKGRWTFRFPECPSDLKFGGVLAGPVLLHMEGEQPITLQQGDCYLLTRGRSFAVASVPGGTPQDGRLAFRDHRGADGVVRYTGPDAGSTPAVHLASGGFTIDDDVKTLLLRQLPPLVHLRADHPASQALFRLVELWAGEMGSARPGAVAARESLAALVLVQVLRTYMETVAQPEGWLRAMGDRRISLALSALHGDLARRWTVEELARLAGMSRTAFATRFRQLVGTPPLDYLTHWRMTVARRSLAQGREPIAAISERVGYLSETAFSAAFRRSNGQSPGRFRSAARAQAAAA